MDTTMQEAETLALEVKRLYERVQRAVDLAYSSEKRYYGEKLYWWDEEMAKLVSLAYDLERASLALSSLAERDGSWETTWLDLVLSEEES